LDSLLPPLADCLYVRFIRREYDRDRRAYWAQGLILISPVMPVDLDCSKAHGYPASTINTQPYYIATRRE